jgi:predicted GIY-YIG superfamily endonuclease
MDPTYVYIIAQELEDAVYFKVGIASDVRARLAQLQTGNPHELEIAFSAGFPTRKIARLIEREAHNYLAKHRAHGEWFLCSYQQIVFALPFAANTHRDRLRLNTAREVLEYMNYPFKRDDGPHQNH